MPIICPYCNKEIELEVAIKAKEISSDTLHISRLALAEDEAKPERLQRYERIAYEPVKDRFLVRLKK